MSNVTAATQFIEVGEQRYAYRRFGSGSGLPLLFLQHFTGTLDNWDPAVTDALSRGRDVILFENAGLGRSTGPVPRTVAGMAQHALAFLDALHLPRCDVLGYSLGGMIAQQLALDRPSIFRRMILVGTAPRGGEDVYFDSLSGGVCRIAERADAGRARMLVDRPRVGFYPLRLSRQRFSNAELTIEAAVCGMGLALGRIQPRR